MGLAFLVSALPAAQTTWTGGGATTDWNTGPNWDNGVPGLTDTAVLSGGTDSVVIGAADAVCMRLVIGAGDTVSLAGGYDLDIGVSGIGISGMLNVASAASRINVAGSWAQTGAFAHGNGVVTFDSTGNFTIDNSVTFSRMFVSKDSSNDTLSSGSNITVTIDDTVNITTGVVRIGASFLELAGSGSGTDLFIMGSGTILDLTESNTFPSGFEEIDLSKSSTVKYTSGSTQIIAYQDSDGDGIVYGNLSCLGETKDAGGALDIDGNVTIGPSGRFDANTDTHTVAGNWTCQNNLDILGSGCIQFDASVFQSITERCDFAGCDVTFKGGGTAAIDSIDTDGNLLITNSTSVVTTNRTRVRGDYTVETGSSYENTSNQLWFDGSGTQVITLGNTVAYWLYFDNGSPNLKKVIGDIYTDDRIYIYNDAAVTDSLDNQDHVSNDGIYIDGDCYFRGTLTLNTGVIPPKKGGLLS